MQLLQVEFNELSPTLLDQFMADGELPNFRRFYEASDVFTTEAHAEPPNLEPWIQWPTVHLGVPHREHGLLHLGANRSDENPGRPPLIPLGQVVQDAGLRVGVFGTMNVSYGCLNGFYVPDPWNTQAVAQPDSLAPYLETVGAMVRESSRTEGLAPVGSLARFGAFMLRNGLTSTTTAVLLKQLAAERRDPGLRWRRASALDWIQYDVFRRLSARQRVDFATFFSNSTAHYQHYFWRHMNREIFETPPDPSDHPSYADAVLFGYQSMDRILGRMFADYPQATFVLCTALSQEPWTNATKQTYRPRDWDAALQLVGLSARDVDVQSVMAEQFVLKFPTGAAAAAAYEAFNRLTLDGHPLIKFTMEGKALIGGCAINYAGATTSQIAGTTDGSRPTMGDIFRPIHTVRSGRHSSKGVLWFRTGRHVVHEQPVELEDIAPSVLALLGITPPKHMAGAALPVAAMPAQF